MDRLANKEVSTDPFGPNVKARSCEGGPDSPPQQEVEETVLISLSEALKIQSELSPKQPLKTEQLKSGSTPLASISRPRPAALRTKSSPRPNRISSESSKGVDLIPAGIPGPQNSCVLPHSKSESAFPVCSIQGPQSPYLNPNSSLPVSRPSPNLPLSLSSNSSLSPQPQRTPSPGSCSPAQSEENKDFR